MNQLEVDYARAIGKIVDLEVLNAELKERLASASVDVMLSQDRLGRIKELKVLNAELVEALQFCENVLSGHPLRSSEAKAWQVAYDTLAKARGEA